MSDRFRKLIGRTSIALMTAAAVAGCGDIGNIRIDLEFPDEASELATAAVLYRAREVPFGRDDTCNDLWGGQAANLAQKESVVLYPNRTDVRALGIDLAPWDELTFFVYAFETTDVAGSTPFLGGCRQAPVDANSTSSIVITLEPAP